LSKLDGVTGVKFDCKVATVTVKPGATLAESAAETALKDAGFGVKTFESGGGVTVGLVKLKIKGFDPAARDSVVEAAQVAVKGSAFATVSDTGDLVVVMKDGKAPEAEKITRALAATEQKVEVSDVAVSDISVGYQRYSVELNDVADAGKALAAATGCDGIVAATIDKSAKKLEVITPEPCANLEEKLGKSLATAGAKIVKLEAI
jgi:hypothetical protein